METEEKINNRNKKLKARKTTVKNTERFLVHRLVDVLHENSKVYIYAQIDYDSPNRVFGSGYDLQLTYKNRTVFVEAKRSLNNKKIIPIEKRLRPSQILACNEILLSRSNYYILDFIVPELDENYTAGDWLQDNDLEIMIYSAEFVKSGKDLGGLKFRKLMKIPVIDSLQRLGFTSSFFKSVLGVK